MFGFNPFVIPLPLPTSMNARLNDSILETTTIVHDIVEEETTVSLLVEAEATHSEDAADLSSLSSTLSPPPPVSPSTACPSCVCTCPTLPPIIPAQATPYIMDNITTSMRLFTL